MGIDGDYWNIRSNTYDGLDDVRSKRTAYKIVDIIRSLSPNRGVSILDIGCATGNITKVIRDNFRHSEVVGIDISKNMIKSAKLKSRDGLRFLCRDMFDLHFMESFKGEFDFVNMSLVLHHLVDEKDKEALQLIIDLYLKIGGYTIISEAVPPDDAVFEYYSDIFKLKENRNCYTEEKLARMMRGAGFSSVKSLSYRFPIRLLKWLDDDTLSLKSKKMIYDMHINSSEKFKKAYQMEFIGAGDYNLSCKMSVVWGKKA